MKQQVECILQLNRTIKSDRRIRCMFQSSEQPGKIPARWLFLAFLECSNLSSLCIHLPRLYEISLRFIENRRDQKHFKKEGLTHPQFFQRFLAVFADSKSTSKKSDYNRNLIRFDNLRCPPPLLKKLRALICTEHNKYHQEYLIAKLLLKS